MDTRHVDLAVRSLTSAAPTSRRRWLAHLAGLAALLPLALDDTAADAKRKKRRRKRKNPPQRACQPDCAGGPCTPDGCGGVCSCAGAGICTEVGDCCDPEGTPCATYTGCCSQTCDSLVGGGTCAPCRGRSCSATRPCCDGLACVNGHCGGCRDRATSCTSTSQCCFSECSSGACLSTAGGRCARDVDCRACYLSHNCTNACVAGKCAF